METLPIEASPQVEDLPKDLQEEDHWDHPEEMEETEDPWHKDLPPDPFPLEEHQKDSLIILDKDSDRLLLNFYLRSQMHCISQGEMIVMQSSK